MDRCGVTVLSPRVLSDDGVPRRMTEQEKAHYNIVVCAVRANRARSAVLDEPYSALPPDTGVDDRYKRWKRMSHPSNKLPSEGKLYEGHEHVTFPTMRLLH